MQTKLEVFSFVELSKALPSLERLTIYGCSLEIDDFISVQAAQFRRMKFFKCAAGYHQNLHIESLSHIIEKCFPSLQCLEVRENKGRREGGLIKLREIPVNCYSFSTTYSGINLLSTSSAKRIRNLCVSVSNDDLECFLSDAAFLTCDFSFKILNVVLDGWRSEQLSLILSLMLKIIEKNPELEVLSLRRKTESEQESSSLVSEWIDANENMIKRCALKLLIFQEVCVLRKLNITALDIRLIDDLDDYGFRIRRSLNKSVEI